MTVAIHEIKVPSMGESVTQATVGRWLKKVGETVKIDELLVELETEKVTLDVMAPASGVLNEILVEEGKTVNVGSILGYLAEGEETKKKTVSPKEGRLTKSKVIDFIDKKESSLAKEEAIEEQSTFLIPEKNGLEERVPMTVLRRTVAKRLKMAQNTAAILTTFNEIDMSALNAIRAHYKENFEQKHGIKLGLMSFFVKAVATALKEKPVVNAIIEGEEIVYKNYYDIGVAVAAPQGLVVPIIRDVDQLSFADIEKTIVNLSKKAKEDTLTLEDLTGGTFTISNGGIFGSLLSTPILNPPQSAILGLHKIQERAVVIDGIIQIRSMMYVALSYDHRLIDGKEAVTFLVRIKEFIENPDRLLLEV